MAEFLKRNEKERKAEKEWLDRFKENFRRAYTNIERYQERAILTSQVILLTIIGAFLVNILTSSLYTILINIDLEHWTFTINLDVLITLISSSLLVVIFFGIRHQLSKYAPSQPVLRLFVQPEDIKNFVGESKFKKIIKYLEDGKLQDFRGFGKNFFESLEKFFSHLFNPEVNRDPIREEEILDEPASNKYPTMIREYDISAMNRTGVKINLEVIIVPDIVYSYSTEGDKTAPYTFYVIFRFKILNPEHCYADDFLEQYYLLYASRVVAITSYSINFAFSKIIPNFWKKKSNTKHKVKN
jgi:hypothetical protein